MPPYAWSIAGLILDIVGAFLLSVEAIKLENIRKLRDRALRPLALTFESPLLTLPTASGEPVPEQNAKRGFGNRIGPYVAAHLVAGAGLALTLNWVLLAAGLDLIRNVSTTLVQVPPALRYTLVPAIALCAAFVVTYLLGEVVIHKLIEPALRAVIACLDAIDRRSPDGSIGLLGFGLLALGFLGQIYGTYSGAQ